MAQGKDNKSPLTTAEITSPVTGELLLVWLNSAEQNRQLLASCISLSMNYVHPVLHMELIRFLLTKQYHNQGSASPGVFPSHLCWSHRPSSGSFPSLTSHIHCMGNVFLNPSKHLNIIHVLTMAYTFLHNWNITFEKGQGLVCLSVL